MSISEIDNIMKGEIEVKAGSAAPSLVFDDSLGLDLSGFKFTPEETWHINFKNGENPGLEISHSSPKSKMEFPAGITIRSPFKRPNIFIRFFHRLLGIRWKDIE